MKRIFKYMGPNGPQEVTPECPPERQRQLEAHYVSEMYNERRWRNNLLSETDYMLIEDATYNGEGIRTSSMYEEIKAFRAALRAYDLKYEPRPVPPSWYKITSH